MPEKPSLERIKIIKTRHEPRLLKQPNVVAVAVGLSQQGTARPVIKVYVSSPSSPTGSVTPEGIPAEIEGVPVEVEVTGEFRPQ